MALASIYESSKSFDAKLTPMHVIRSAKRIKIPNILFLFIYSPQFNCSFYTINIILYGIYGI